jgi:hypothetical protein
MDENTKIILRNKIGLIPVTKDRDANDDNLSLALVLYFESMPECPIDDLNEDHGLSQWAMDKANDLLDRIVKELKVNHHDIS